VDKDLSKDGTRYDEAIGEQLLDFSKQGCPSS
jgi:hypothetical protein